MWRTHAAETFTSQAEQASLSSREQPVGVSDQLDASPARDGCERRDMQWFKIPAKTYFEPNAIKYLRDMYGIEKAVIVCDKAPLTIRSFYEISGE